MSIYEYKLDGTPAQEAAIEVAIRFGVILTILEPGEDKTPAQELTDDLLSLIASFSERLYEMRSPNRRNSCSAHKP